MEVTATMQPIIIGAVGIAAIEQNIRVIVLTLAYSVPLDRAFANVGSFIDAPLPYAVAKKIAELTAAIEKYEPRVKVEKIAFKPLADEAQQGKLHPVITYHVREGVEL